MDSCLDSCYYKKINYIEEKPIKTKLKIAKEACVTFGLIYTEVHLNAIHSTVYQASHQAIHQAIHLVIPPTEHPAHRRQLKKLKTKLYQVNQMNRSSDSALYDFIGVTFWSEHPALNVSYEGCSSRVYIETRSELPILKFSF